MMSTLTAAQPFLDQQTEVAIWYAEYDGRDESIRYANAVFAEVFDMSVDDVLEKRRYHLANPPGTAAEVIEQYKDEDHEAMQQGIFLARSSVEAGTDIVVVKLRFDRGMLGMFKFVAANADAPRPTLQNVDAELLGIVQQVRPDLREDEC